MLLSFYWWHAEFSEIAGDEEDTPNYHPHVVTWWHTIEGPPKATPEINMLRTGTMNSASCHSQNVWFPRSANVVIECSNFDMYTYDNIYICKIEICDA